MLGEKELTESLEQARALLKEMKTVHTAELNTWMQKQAELSQKIQIRINELKDVEMKQQGKIEAFEDILGIKKDDGNSDESKPVAGA